VSEDSRRLAAWPRSTRLVLTGGSAFPGSRGAADCRRPKIPAKAAGLVVHTPTIRQDGAQAASAGARKKGSQSGARFYIGPGDHGGGKKRPFPENPVARPLHLGTTTTCTTAINTAVSPMAGSGVLRGFRVRGLWAEGAGARPGPSPCASRNEAQAPPKTTAVRPKRFGNPRPAKAAAASMSGPWAARRCAFRPTRRRNTP